MPHPNNIVRRYKALASFNKIAMIEWTDRAHSVTGSLDLLKEHAAAMFDCAHRLRCAYDLPVPSDDEIKKWIAVEVARSLGQTSLLMDFVDIDASVLANPSTTPSIHSVTFRTAKALSVALQAQHREQELAEQTADDERAQAMLKAYAESQQSTKKEKTNA